MNIWAQTAGADYERNEAGEIREHVLVVPYVPEAIVWLEKGGKAPLLHRWHLSAQFCFKHGLDPVDVGRIQLPELDWANNAPATMTLYVKTRRPDKCD